MIAAGIFFLFSGHVRGDCSSLALGAELGRTQSAKMRNLLT